MQRELTTLESQERIRQRRIEERRRRGGLSLAELARRAAAMGRAESEERAGRIREANRGPDSAARRRRSRELTVIENQDQHYQRRLEEIARTGGLSSQEMRRRASTGWVEIEKSHPINPRREEE